MAESTGEEIVDAALAALAHDDPEAARAAEAGFDSLTWGEGLEAVSIHGLADFLWYQLPLKWICDLDEKLHVASALGDLFTRLGEPRYAALCTMPATGEILTTYEQRGEAAGIKAYRAALEATGARPPDVPGVLNWGTVMGADEASAYWSATAALEHAVDTGELTPGARGWRAKAQQITIGFLHSLHDEITGTTWLQWLHTERLQNWTTSRGPPVPA